MATEFDLMVAPNGARLTRADHPALPITPAQLAETARACADAGATALHLHVRDGAGQHSLDATHYAEAITAIAALTPLPVQITTEAAGVFDVATQIACLRDAPARDASVALREVERDPALQVKAYRTAEEAGKDVQHILYNAADVAELIRLMEARVITAGSRRALFVLGRYSADQQSTPKDLQPFLSAMGTVPLSWSVCAFGRREHDCLMAALELGGQVRLGFENNRHAPDGTPYADNAASVAAFVARARAAGFTPRKAQT